MPKTGSKKPPINKKTPKQTAAKKTPAVKQASPAQLKKELRQREAELAIIKSVQDGLASKL